MAVISTLPRREERAGPSSGSDVSVSAPLQLPTGHDSARVGERGELPHSPTHGTASRTLTNRQRLPRAPYHASGFVYARECVLSAGCKSPPNLATDP